MQGSEPPVSGDNDDDWPSPRTAWTALALLMMALVVSVMDRTAITLMVEPIKGEYGLSDTQFGALIGIAFGTFYATMAIPIGVLVDRYPRRLVVGIGVGIFSIFSMATGLTRNYTQLFVARMGVGFGEASISPAGYSMISDYFPPEKLGRATSLFAMSNFLGSSLSYLVGGLLIGVFEARAASPAGAALEQGLGLSPWQATIMCIALPGIILTPFLLLLREPRRRGLIAGKPHLGLAELLRELGMRRRFLTLMLAGMAVASLMIQSVALWTPTLFIRVYGWNAREVGLSMGVVVFLGGVIGSYAAGWLTDRLTARGRLDGPIRVAALSFLAAGLFAVAAPLMPTGELALVLVLPALFLQSMCFACAPISLQMVIPNQLRGQVIAVYMTILNLIGVAIGPLLIGLLTDHLFTDPTDVRYSMALVSAVTMPIMVTLMLLAVCPFRILREEMPAR